MRSKKLQLVVLALLLVGLGLVITQRQAIQDWFRLRGYTPPAAVVTLAQDDTMTAEAKHLFYVNRPDITNGLDFTKNCPQGSEKTVVLGCYVGDDAGIYIYKVQDPRLDGVEQVTAAHEMLHAAYRRLDEGERRTVDAMLTDYYQHDLTDQRIKDTIASYKKSEPHDVVDEMHSVFGTEVAHLPAPLERYYRQYFTDRAKVASYTAQYQSEFASRQAQVAGYDKQLHVLKAQITSNEAQLNEQGPTLTAQSRDLQASRRSDSPETYNRKVASYNAAAGQYNDLLAATKRLISQYNTIVDERNSVALEEQQLVQALSPSSLPSDR